MYRNFTIALLTAVSLIAITMMTECRVSLAQEANEAVGQQSVNVVFFGDSITEAAVGEKGYITRLDQVLNNDRANGFQLIGAGISGNKVPDLQKRLDRDVLAKNPKLVVIYIGINDVWHSLSGKGTPVDQFRDGLMDIIQRIQAYGASVILCTPSVIGERTDGGNPLDAKLDEYATISREVAAGTGVRLVDLRQLFLHELKIVNPDNEANGHLTTDGVHLNDAGNEFVQECLGDAIRSTLQGQVVRHVVLVQFKQTTTIAQMNRVRESFAALEGKIEAIKEFEGGSDISVENRNLGFTDCFVLTFENVAARDAYLVHPEHEAFKQFALQFVEKVLVVDYLAAD